MAEKKTKLSIIIATVDKATAKIKAINERIDAATKPIRNFKEALSDLGKKSGLDDVIGGFKGVGSAISGILTKLAIVGGVAALAVRGLFGLVAEFDDLGDKAERLGVSVDFLASMRYAAEKAGAPVEALDQGLQNFSQNVGQLRAKTGRLYSFLEKVSPTLLKQVKAAKSNEEAFDLMAGAIAKVSDPAKRAALAQKAFGDSALAPLLARGSKGVAELRARYLELAGSQQDAADKAGAVDDSLHDLHAATDGLKAAILSGLAPALKIIVDRLRDWLKGHRADLKEWAEQLGKKLPEAVSKLVGGVKGAVAAIMPFIDSGTKLKIVAGVLAAIIVGPLVASIYTLGVALLTTPVGWIIGGIAAIAAGAYELIKHWDAVSGFFVGLWDAVKAKFGWAANILKIVLWPFIGIPGLIISNWGAITGFFGDLWDGVKSAFSAAWDYIKPIVDKVIWAAGKLEDLGGALFGKVSMPQLGAAAPRLQIGGGDVSAQAQAAMGGPSWMQGAKITVDITGAPRGTRASVAPGSDADVDLSVGYNLLGATP